TGLFMIAFVVRLLVAPAVPQFKNQRPSVRGRIHSSGLSYHDIIVAAPLSMIVNHDVGNMLPIRILLPYANSITIYIPVEDSRTDIECRLLITHIVQQRKGL